MRKALTVNGSPSSKEAAAVSNEEIVEQIQKGIEVTTNQERLWKKNRPYVIRCIRKYIGECDPQDFEDYINEGYIGLVTAASRYKAGQGTKFLTYATFHIRAALYRYNGLNTYTVHIPEYLKERIRKLAAFKQEYRNKFHREPNQEEIQKALCISYRSLCHLEKILLNMRTRSLDEYISDDGDTSFLDILSTDEKIDELAGGGEYQKQLHEVLEEALSILDDRTALMIRCVYYQQNSYTKTAEIFRCTRQAVDERIKKGFYKILHSKYRKKLEGFMWEGYYMKPSRLSGYVDMEGIDTIGCEFLL